MKEGEGGIYGQSNVKTDSTTGKIDNGNLPEHCNKQPRGVGWGGSSEGGSRGRGHRYAAG